MTEFGSIVHSKIGHCPLIFIKIFRSGTFAFSKKSQSLQRIVSASTKVIVQLVIRKIRRRDRE